MPRGFEQRASRVHSYTSVFRPCYSRDIKSYQGIADEPVDQRIGMVEDLGGSLVIAIDKLMKRGGPDLFGQRGGVAHIGKEHREQEFHTHLVFLDDLFATVTQVAVETGSSGTKAERPD